MALLFLNGVSTPFSEHIQEPSSSRQQLGVTINLDERSSSSEQSFLQSHALFEAQNDAYACTRVIQLQHAAHCQTEISIDKGRK